MDIALGIAITVAWLTFMVAIARAGKLRLSLVALGLTALLAVALVLQATVAEDVGGWAAMVLGGVTVTVIGAARFFGGDDDVDLDL